MSCAFETQKKCEQIYYDIEQSATLETPLQKAKAMESAGTDCIATGMYDVRLAYYYQDAGDFQSSVNVAENALRNTSDTRPNLLHVLAMSEYRTGSQKKAINMSKEILNEYPKYAPILSILIEHERKKQNWEGVLDYAEKGLDTEYRALSLLVSAGALHQMNRHEEVVDRVYEALEIEPDRIGRITGILEAIFSLAILDRRDEATDLARKHIKANPRWQDNKTFAQAAKELGLVNQK